MKRKYRTAFFIFGLVLLIVMVTQLDVRQVWDGMRSAGYWFFAVLALWAVIYLLNNLTWHIIIKEIVRCDRLNVRVNFWWLYKISVSAFALNYATPGGLMGGEPYRIMELSPKIGTERASASVMLYVMTHIFSCFCFWALGAVAYVLFMPVDMYMAMLLTAAGAFMAAGFMFFITGYRKGFAVKGMSMASHIPLVKRWTAKFTEKHINQLRDIDNQVASFHKKSNSALLAAIALELLSYIASALEVMFILWVIVPDISFLKSYLILSFTSLFANLLFFMPLQLGGREGGFLMSATALGLTASSAVFVALIVRIRELIWTGIGLLIINFANKTMKKNNRTSDTTNCHNNT